MLTPIADALAMVRAESRPVSAEMLPLQAAAGRILAGTVHCPMPLPPFDNSAMDGFALRAGFNGIAAGEEFAVSGEQAAGDVARAAGEGAWEIMTGARVPDGFDAVIPVEQVDILQRDAGGRPARIRLLEPVAAGKNLRRAGQDIARGAVAVSAGERLGPFQCMLLGGMGIVQVSVRRRPRVAIISTGRELVDEPGRELDSGEIYNTNGPYLAARLVEAGAEVVHRVSVTDAIEPFLAELARAEALGADLILSTGAVSMGRYDFVPEALARIGATTLFHKLRMRPGKPLLFARLASGRLYFGLPGNPVSSALGQRLFVEAAIRRMLGMPDERPWRMRLAEAAQKKSGFALVQKAVPLCDESGQVRVRLLQGQESFRVQPLLRTRLWALLPEDAERLDAGTPVEVLPTGHMQSDAMEYQE